MGRILVFVDHDPSSKKAFKAAIHAFDKNTDELILINFYSSWDYLNEDKNTGRLTLHEFKNYAETLGFTVQDFQYESSSIAKDALEEVEKKKANSVFIGLNTFAYVSEDTNLVYWFFSAISRFFKGSVADYLKKWSMTEVKIIE